MFRQINEHSDSGLPKALKTLKIQFASTGRPLLPKVNNIKTSSEKLFQKKSSSVHSGSAAESLDFGGCAAYDNVLIQGVIFVQPVTG